MRDLILSTMVSLDGYFADPDGQLDWFAVSDDLEDHLREVLRQVPKYVASTSLEQVDWENSHLIRDVPGDVEKLKQEPGKAIFVAGSADLADSLIRHGLVDEYRISVNPILLGAGTPLFKGGFDRLPLRLVDQRQLSSGLLVLRYRPRAGIPA